jgi:hypothetical protein
MSKRTPASSKTPSDTPKTRNRATSPAVDTTIDTTPKAPRTRRKAQPPSQVAVAAETALVAVSETTIVAAAIDARRTPSHDEIATRAYFIALERGFSSDPLADWLAAERELRLA